MLMLTTAITMTCQTENEFNWSRISKKSVVDRGSKSILSAKISKLTEPFINCFPLSGSVERSLLTAAAESYRRGEGRKAFFYSSELLMFWLHE